MAASLRSIAMSMERRTFGRHVGIALDSKVIS